MKPKATVFEFDEPRILLVRGKRVILDSDLARLYQVPTHRLNEATKRNADRFPADFRFQLTDREYGELHAKSFRAPSQDAEVDKEAMHSSQIAISSRKHRGRSYRPWAFTEHGALMAATVLRSKRAVAMSVYVVRAFVRLREMLGAHRELSAKLAELERKVAGHDDALGEVFETIRQLLEPPETPRKEMGFHTRLGSD